MTGAKKDDWKIFMTKFRDIIFIVMFLATTIGWITTAVSDKVKIKMVLEQNTKAINDINEQIKGFNNYINKQSELNGKIIQYMKDEKK
jgi:hypothetical protein